MPARTNPERAREHHRENVRAEAQVLVSADILSRPSSFSCPSVPESELRMRPSRHGGVLSIVRVASQSSDLGVEGAAGRGDQRDELRRRRERRLGATVLSSARAGVWSLRPRATGDLARAAQGAERTVDASAYDENASSSVDAAAALARTSRVASVCRTLRPSRPISIAPDPGSAPRRRRPRILPRAATTLVRSLESLETPLLVVALHPLLDVKTQRTAQQGKTHQVQLRPTAAHGTGGTRAGACDVRA